jgi:hypothetical protein
LGTYRDHAVLIVPLNVLRTPDRLVETSWRDSFLRRLASAQRTATGRWRLKFRWPCPIVADGVSIILNYVGWACSQRGLHEHSGLLGSAVRMWYGTQAPSHKGTLSSTRRQTSGAGDSLKSCSTSFVAEAHGTSAINNATCSLQWAAATPGSTWSPRSPVLAKVPSCEQCSTVGVWRSCGSPPRGSCETTSWSTTSCCLAPICSTRTSSRGEAGNHPQPSESLLESTCSTWTLWRSVCVTACVLRSRNCSACANN